MKIDQMRVDQMRVDRIITILKTPLRFCHLHPYRAMPTTTTTTTTITITLDTATATVMLGAEDIPETTRMVMPRTATVVVDPTHTTTSARATHSPRLFCSRHNRRHHHLLNKAIREDTRWD